MVSLAAEISYRPCDQRTCRVDILLSRFSWIWIAPFPFHPVVDENTLFMRLKIAFLKFQRFY
jgi:hypothetical protein